MSEIKWIKIVTDVFDNRKIKQIENMPDSDSIIVIWFKLICLAGKINENGEILLTDDVPYTDEMLANEFNKPINTIRLALTTFVNFKMVCVIDNIYKVSNWEKYQNVDGMDKIREQTRQRVTKYREKTKLLGESKCNVTCNATLTQGNATDIDIEEDKEKKIYIPYSEILESLNKACEKNFKMVEANKKPIKARWNEGYTLDDFKTVIDKKAKEWLGTEQAKYLRPETLFGNKFDGYLNQIDTPPKQQQKFTPQQDKPQAKPDCPDCHGTGQIKVKLGDGSNTVLNVKCNCIKRQEVNYG